MGFFCPEGANSMEPGGFSPRETANTPIFRPEGAGADRASVPSGRIRKPPVFLGLKTPGFMLPQLRCEKPILVSPPEEGLAEEPSAKC